MPYPYMSKPKHFIAQELTNAEMIHPYDVYDLMAPIDAPAPIELGYVEEMIYAGLPWAFVVKRRVFELGGKTYIETASTQYKSTSFPEPTKVT